MIGQQYTYATAVPGQQQFYASAAAPGMEQPGAPAGMLQSLTPPMSRNESMQSLHQPPSTSPNAAAAAAAAGVPPPQLFQTQPGAGSPFGQHTFAPAPGTTFAYAQQPQAQPMYATLPQMTPQMAPQMAGQMAGHMAGQMAGMPAGMSAGMPAGMGGMVPPPGALAPPPPLPTAGFQLQAAPAMHAAPQQASGVPEWSLRQQLTALNSQTPPRALASVATPPVVAPAHVLIPLLDAAARACRSDAERVDLLKTSVSPEVALQLRDALVDDAGGALMRLCVEHRATPLVAVIEILGTLDASCARPSDAAVPAGAPAFYTLTRALFSSFDALCTGKRGHIALLRMLSAAAGSPLVVDEFVSAVIPRVSSLARSDEGNYIVSSLLTHFDAASPAAAAAAATTGQNREASLPLRVLPEGELLSATATTLRLAPRPALCTAGPGGDAAKVRCVSPSLWAAFGETLVAALSRDIVASATHKATSHVLEAALRRMSFVSCPSGLRLVSLLSDAERVLLPLCEDPSGFHIVTAFAETVAAVTPERTVSPAELRNGAVNALRQLTEPPLVATAMKSKYWDTVNMAARRAVARASELQQMQPGVGGQQGQQAFAGVVGATMLAAPGQVLPDQLQAQQLQAQQLQQLQVAGMQQPQVQQVQAQVQGDAAAAIVAQAAVNGAAAAPTAPGAVLPMQVVGQ